MSTFPRIEPLRLLPHLGKWLVISAATAVLAGSASAFFLLALDHATAWRETHR